MLACFVFLFVGDEHVECPICLQPCIHPVQLPCTHIFCFLCVKGVANQSKRCALCRSEIPADYLNHPALVHKEDLLKDIAFEDGYQWFYEGTRGWWQYDERANAEIEEHFKNEEKEFEVLIAGFLYVVDLERHIQYRRNDPTRRRRIKRDLKTIPDKKGVAGLKVMYGSQDMAPPVRRDGDGGEGDSRLSGAKRTPQSIPPSNPARTPPAVTSPVSNIQSSHGATPARSGDPPVPPRSSGVAGNDGNPRTDSARSARQVLGGPALNTRSSGRAVNAAMDASSRSAPRLRSQNDSVPSAAPQSFNLPRSVTGQNEVDGLLPRLSNVSVMDPPNVRRRPPQGCGSDTADAGPRGDGDDSDDAP